MTTATASILVIEDDAKIRDFLKIGLENDGYRYAEAANGQNGLTALQHKDPQLVILDLGLPDMDGLDFIKQARETSRTPIIVLTARDQEQDKVHALDQGADDYLTKPFGIEELLARVRVALRHAAKTVSADEPITFENGPLKIDFATRTVLVNGEEIHLTPTEYKLLELLAKNVGKVLTQRQLLHSVWGPSAAKQTQYLRVHMHQLRHKIEENPARPKWLINEPCVGYRLKLA
jgi:two-component system KDP operon response regulator KdpE